MTHPLFIESFPHNRRFGLELEFFNISQDRVERVLRRAGIKCWNPDNSNYCNNFNCLSDCSICSDNTPSSTKGWKITDDGSIVGNDTVELVSPILSGPAGLLEVAKVVELMAAAGAKVNKSCGFHVHVDAQDLSGKTLLNVYRRYALHEAQIDTFMSASRRGNNNAYCESSTRSLDRLNLATTDMSPDQIANLMDEYWVSGQGCFGGRYNKVNLCAYLRHGTIEFRHHGGTMNVNKVLNWIAFCVNFVVVSIDTDTANIFTGVHPDSVQFFNQRAADLA
jgi:hypothetical protein